MTTITKVDLEMAAEALNAAFRALDALRDAPDLARADRDDVDQMQKWLANRALRIECWGKR